ncbi:MAG: hypothetical protein J6S96_09290 [Muribaculaceae bacterium]|nr:hypothetical protein [Muribaculaceae bacterium]
MKRLIFSLISLLSLAPICQAMIVDEVGEVTVSASDPTQSYIFNSGNTGAIKVEVSVKENDETGFWVDIALYNEDQYTYLPIFVFDSSYTKKELKKLKNPKIELKGNLFTDVENVMPASITFPDGQREMVLEKGAPIIIENESPANYLRSQKIEFGETAILHLPVYIVDAKNSKMDKKKGTYSKVVITRWLVYELNITANGKRRPKVDAEYEGFEAQVNALEERLSEKRYCTGTKKRKHNPSLKTQKKEDLDAIKNLRSLITAQMQNYSRDDDNWDAFNELRDRVDDCERKVNGKSLEYVCDNCLSGKSDNGGGYSNSKKHSCGYCNVNAAQRMNQIATAVKRNGNVTSQQLSEAKGLYNCAKARNALTTGIKNDYSAITSKSGKSDNSGNSNSQKHSCSYCKVNAAQRMSKIATEVKRSGKATQQQKNEANGLYNCAKARNALSTGIQNDYSTIMKK